MFKSTVVLSTVESACIFSLVFVCASLSFNALCKGIVSQLLITLNAQLCFCFGLSAII